MFETRYQSRTVDLLFDLFEFSCCAYDEIETYLLAWSNPNQTKPFSDTSLYSSTGLDTVISIHTINDKFS